MQTAKDTNSKPAMMHERHSQRLPIRSLLILYCYVYSIYLQSEFRLSMHQNF